MTASQEDKSMSMEAGKKQEETKKCIWFVFIVSAHNQDYVIRVSGEFVWIPFEPKQTEASSAVV